MHYKKWVLELLKYNNTISKVWVNEDLFFNCITIVQARNTQNILGQEFINIKFISVYSLDFGEAGFRQGLIGATLADGKVLHLKEAEILNYNIKYKEFEKIAEFEKVKLFERDGYLEIEVNIYEE